ncbi:MAG TPA: class I SAM-dependent methyltransferase [Deltaproteobacteria bacterium]|nr:class I SAM-dependent methyltransferase [Deltaproteobacteria bacterium]
MNRCRVCTTGNAVPFISVEGKDYWRCRRCQATFLDPSQLPDGTSERERYLLHENNPDDPGYRSFLSRLAEPLLERLDPGQEGLDYGCGPGPALACMLVEAGHRVHLYDPFFHPDGCTLERSYDFITCTEVVEHFHNPAREFITLQRLLKPGGWLGIMTCFQTDDASFPNWHYRREPTHVVFYREETFYRIASDFGWLCEIPKKDIVLMRKPLG